MANFTAKEWDKLRDQYGVEKVTRAPGNPHCLYSPFRARTPSPRSFFAEDYPIYPDQGVYSKIYAALRAGKNPWETKNETNNERDDENTNRTPMTHEVRIIDGLDGEQNQGDHGANQHFFSKNGLGDEPFLIEDSPDNTRHGNDDGDKGDAGSATGVVPPVALPGHFTDDDPSFRTPDRKTKSFQSPKNGLSELTQDKTGDLTTYVPGSDSTVKTIKTAGSIEEYSSNTSCESAVAKLAHTLGQSGCRKVSKSDFSSSDFEAMTPVKIDWKDLVASDSGGLTFGNVKMGGSVSSSSRPHPYLKHP